MMNHRMNMSPLSLTAVQVGPLAELIAVQEVLYRHRTLGTQRCELTAREIAALMGVDVREAQNRLFRLSRAWVRVDGKARRLVYKKRAGNGCIYFAPKIIVLNESIA